jgi:hypothetical protein
VGVLIIVISEAYPGGFTGFAWKIVRTLLKGFH